MKLSPGAMDSLCTELSCEMTEWAKPSLLVHVTVVPAATASSFGPNAKSSIVTAPAVTSAPAASAIGAAAADSALAGCGSRDQAAPSARATTTEAAAPSSANVPRDVRSRLGRSTDSEARRTTIAPISVKSAIEACGDGFSPDSVNPKIPSPVRLSANATSVPAAIATPARRTSGVAAQEQQ